MNATDRIEVDRLGELNEELNDDHKQIMTLVDELIVPHTPRSTDELVVLLQELQNSLQKHISREQSPGGLYDYLGAFHPDYCCELGMMMLLKEHISMLSTIHDLTDRAVSSHTNHAGDALTLELYHGATDLSVCLVEHELKENTIISRLTQSPQPHGQAMVTWSSKNGHAVKPRWPVSRFSQIDPDSDIPDTNVVVGCCRTL